MNEVYFCPNCATPVAYGRRFCGNCGIELNWTESQISYPASPVNQQYSQQESASQYPSSNNESHQHEPYQQYWHGKYYPVTPGKRSFSSGFAAIAVVVLVFVAIGGSGFVTGWNFFGNFSSQDEKSAMMPSAPISLPPVSGNATQEKATLPSEPQLTIIPVTPQVQVSNSPASTPGTGEKPNIVIADFEQQIHSLINSERQKNNLSPLPWNAQLNVIARKHSEDMALRNYFNHATPEGYGPAYRYQQGGYSSNCYGENIFKCPLAKVYWYHNGVLSEVEYYQKSEMAALIVKGWMDSPGHRANILNPAWTTQSIGVAISSDGDVYITEDFA